MDQSDAASLPSVKPSHRLFRPVGGGLESYSSVTALRTRKIASAQNQELIDLVNRRDYPCIAAQVAIKTDEYRLGSYENLGSGRYAYELGRDLYTFKHEQKRSGSKFLSFIATFEGAEFATEKEFEDALWRELSFVSAIPEFDAPWDPHFSDNPADKDFCFSFDGSAFFVVGLHAQSSRKARRFSVPTLIFNLYDQFEQLDEETEFYPMVRTNRKKDIAFQGSVNPMVEQYAEKWESIQFSGKENPPEWKCPFQRWFAMAGRSH